MNPVFYLLLIVGLFNTGLMARALDIYRDDCPDNEMRKPPRFGKRSSVDSGAKFPDSSLAISHFGSDSSEPTDGSTESPQEMNRKRRSYSACFRAPVRRMTIDRNVVRVPSFYPNHNPLSSLGPYVDGTNQNTLNFVPSTLKSLRSSDQVERKIIDSLVDSYGNEERMNDYSQLANSNQALRSTLIRPQSSIANAGIITTTKPQPNEIFYRFLRLLSRAQ